MRGKKLWMESNRFWSFHKSTGNNKNGAKMNEWMENKKSLQVVCAQDLKQCRCIRRLHNNWHAKRIPPFGLSFSQFYPCTRGEWTDTTKRNRWRAKAVEPSTKANSILTFEPRVLHWRAAQLNFVSIHNNFQHKHPSISVDSRGCFVSS